MPRIRIQKLSDQQKKNLSIPESPKSQGAWSVWECEPSTFDWHYDCDEKAYVYEGCVLVKTRDERVEIKAGDFVVFPKGLSCTWEVIEKIKKVYKFE